MKWLVLIMGILSNASASVLIKMAMSPLRKSPSFSDPLAILTNWPLILGVALYGLAFVLYAITLTRLPLSVAHPILTSGSIAIVAVLSVVIFGEQIRAINMVGIGLILLGVSILTMTMN